MTTCGPVRHYLPLFLGGVRFLAFGVYLWTTFPGTMIQKGPVLLQAFGVAAAWIVMSIYFVLKERKANDEDHIREDT